MSSALKRLAQQVPQFARSFKSSNLSKAIEKGKTPLNHNEVVHGDGHTGLRPGYNYDYEHGPHYLRLDKVTNYRMKYRIGWVLFFATGLGIPPFMVWWQQRKAQSG
ncbi:MAG: hypothetical protein WDW38_002373 [Sanguina aurantia]